METQYTVTHISVKLESGFAEFTRELEAALGRLDVPALTKAGHDAEATTLAIKAMQGEDGMTLFNIEDLGHLLSLNGPSRTAKRYFVGNYLRASQIISTDIRLGLYAPLRVLVYEAEDQTAYAEYDLPSSQFSMFGDELITKSGFGLDTKLKNIITLADEWAKLKN
ncbi:DUF302 domain-containing protein [Mucilaginibacter paludis]|uniref:DUF302 domain-containing protein n=1 Tax=Mucilaginibacter paludis DSM 18603 TaxID=714943 RepID=H1YD58_9SPHI|nr:DUF302 domain-containing protein [Mucilaginibacter paludis]EHQ26115.1 protein of unknown function DUF302 [Mucilaginibacter paludis DSM 18603]